MVRDGINELQWSRRSKMGLLENRFNDNVIVEKLDKLLSWGRSTSPWFFQFGTACCAIEMMAAAASRHDLMRIGMIPRSSPRQADVMLVAGTVTMKMALSVKTFTNKWITLNIVIPVDVYVPGCPPRPEALIEGLLKLQEQILGERPLTRKMA